MAKDGSGFEKRLEAAMPKDAAPNGAALAGYGLIDVSVRPRRRYRRCRPSFTVGRWPILVTGPTACPQPRGPGRQTQPTAETMESPVR
jgi:hypothetical protein